MIVCRNLIDPQERVAETASRPIRRKWHDVETIEDELMEVAELVAVLSREVGRQDESKGLVGFGRGAL